MAQLSQIYGKSTALTIWTFVNKISLLWSMLPYYVCYSFPSKDQASFNFMAAVPIYSDFGAQKNKIWHCFHCSPSISYKVMGPDAMIFVFWMLSFKPTFSLSSFTLWHLNFILKPNEKLYNKWYDINTLVFLENHSSWSLATNQRQVRPSQGGDQEPK